MKNQLFEDLIESIKELPTEILEEMRVNMNEEDAPEITSEWVKNATLINGNQMRKDFEEWDFTTFGEDGYDVDECGNYMDNIKQQCWMTWKACKDFYEKED